MFKTSCALGLAAGLVVLAPAAFAHPVAVFDDPAVVDSANGLSSESDTVQQALTALGHDVTPFGGLDGGAFTAALSGQLNLVLPEPEIGPLTQLAPEAVTRIVDFVFNGGRLVAIFPATRMVNFLNSAFGFALGYTGCQSAGLIDDTAGTGFESSVASIGCMNATVTLVGSTLPAGAQSVYTNAQGNSLVAFLPFGSGSIVTLGWDFFNAAPLGSVGANDWLPVLDLSLIGAQGTTVPVPATLALFGLGLIGLAAHRRRTV